MNFEKMSFEEWQEFSETFRFMGLTLADIRAAVQFAESHGWHKSIVVSARAPISAPPPPVITPEIIPVTGESTVEDLRRMLDAPPTSVPVISIPGSMVPEGAVSILNDRGMTEIIDRVAPTPAKKRNGPFHSVKVRRWVLSGTGQRAMGPLQIYENISSVQDLGEMMALNQQMSPAHAATPIYIPKDELAGLDMD